MIARTALMALTLVALPAMAGDFERRAEAAHALEQAPDQGAYQGQIRAAANAGVREAMKTCRSTHSDPNSPPPPFGLVGDITRSGSLENVEAYPDHDFARCVGREMAGVALPSPPDSYSGDKYPFAMEVHFH